MSVPPLRSLLLRRIELKSYSVRITLLALLYAALLLLLAPRVALDLDEGFYLLATQRVLQGQVVYHDFVYCQAPLLPYAYAVWGRVCGVSWKAERVLSVLLTSLLGLLVSIAAARQQRDGRAGMVALVLFASSALVLYWGLVVKTYALSSVLGFGAYLLLLEGCSRGSRGALFGSGLLIALACGTRALYLFLLPVFFGYVWCQARPAWRAALSALCAGLALGLLPTLLFFWWDPAAFVFGNLGFHVARHGTDTVANLTAKLHVLMMLMGIQSAAGSVSFQSILLLGACIAAAVHARAFRNRLPLAFWIAAILGIASALPTPIQVQYFVLLIPFVIVVVVQFAFTLARQLEPQPAIRAMWAGCCRVALLAYLVAGGIEACNWAGLQTPWSVPLKPNESWKIADRVTAFSNSITRSGEPVWSSWPGYAVGAHWSLLKGLETNLGYLAVESVPIDLDRVGLMSYRSAYAIITGHRVRVIIMGLMSEFWTDLSEVALRSGYHVVSSEGQVRILTL